MTKTIHKQWAIAVKEKANNTCDCCLISNKQMSAYCLNTASIHRKVEDGVCLCKVCYKAFNKWHKGNYGFDQYNEWKALNQQQLIAEQIRASNILRGTEKIEQTKLRVQWGNAVKAKANYVCQRCETTQSKMEAHHLYSYEDYPEKRFEIDNGVCLCVICHLGFHQWHKAKYGLRFGRSKPCTAEQYLEWSELINKKEATTASQDKNISTV